MRHLERRAPRGPMVNTPAAKKAHLRYLKEAKRRANRPAQGDRP